MVVMQRHMICPDEFDQRRQEQAAVIIQAQIRKYLAIKMVDRLRYERESIRVQERRVTDAAITLQKHVRRFLAERYVDRLKTRHSSSPIDREKHRMNEERAAIVIQSQIRRFLATRRVQRIRDRRNSIREIQEKHAALVIQRFYRNYKQERDHRFEQAAVTLQSHIRKFLALRRYKRIKATSKKNDQISKSEEAMQVDQLDGIKRLHDKNIDLSDDNLNAACDRLISETTKAAKAVDNVGPLNKSGKKYDDYSAAVAIQKSWRGYNTRRRHSDILEKLQKTRLSLRNAPNIADNPREHRQMTIAQRLNDYVPMFYSNNLKKRQLAASFINRITKDSQEFTKEFLNLNGIQALIASSTNLGRDYAEVLLQKELAELLWTCLKSTASEKDVNNHIEELLKLLVVNVNKHRKNASIMKVSCDSIHKLCQHPESPAILKNLKFPYYVSQWRKELGSSSKSELLDSLKKAEESLKMINALPE